MFFFFCLIAVVSTIETFELLDLFIVTATVIGCTIKKDLSFLVAKFFPIFGNEFGEF